MNEPTDLAAEFATIRAGVNHRSSCDWTLEGGECDCGATESLAALGRLAAREGDAVAQYIDQYGVTCDGCGHVLIDATAGRDRTPQHGTAGDPEAEGSACAHCMHADGSEQNEIARLRAECDDLRAKVEDTEVWWGKVKSHEILTTELAQARKATEEAQEQRDAAVILLRAKTDDAAWGKYPDSLQDAVAEEYRDLAAELRRAVDALRPYARNHVNKAACEIVAAYDAKHGEVKP